MTVNLFKVLDEMNQQHEGSVHAYFSNNIENINAGKQGWGNIKIAITTGDAQELMNGLMDKNMTKSVMLFIVDRKVMSEVQSKLEDENVE